MLCDSAPDLPPEDFEDVVEVSTVVPPGATPGWASWAAETGGPLPDVVPGSYRLRVSARGRAAGRAADTSDGVVDEYLIELWPAAPQLDAILRTGGEEALYWHRTWGRRR
jgi:hypothetical protein